MTAVEQEAWIKWYFERGNTDEPVLIHDVHCYWNELPLEKQSHIHSVAWKTRMRPNNDDSS
jgi:hypothetical protein